VSEPGLSMPLTLTSLQELQADAIAGRVLDRIAPGNGPMIIPEWAADLFGRWGEMGGWVSQSILYGPGAQVLEIRTTATASKTLSLELHLFGEGGQGRIWAGVLRGHSFGS
jgi:hypothetical protein